MKSRRVDKVQAKIAYERGDSLREIAAGYGVTTHAIRFHAHREGWRRPVRTWVSTAKQLFELGERCDRIGVKVGVDGRTVEAKAIRSGWRRLSVPCRHCGVPVPAQSNRANPRRCADCRSAYVREHVSGKRWEDRADGRDDGSLTKAVVRALFAAAKKCPYCWHPMRSSDKSLDHKEPLSRGGWHSVSNVLVCCLRCNARKHARSWDEWLAMIPAPCATALNGAAA